MATLNERFEHVFIHRDSLNSPVAQRIFSQLPKEKISVVESEPLTEKKGDLSAREFTRSKRLLYLCEFKGQFFKRCPGSRPGLACCNYFVLNLGQQCDMNCSYCYLQSFLNSPLMTVYSNLEQALAELQEAFPRDKALRVGTGEVIDSLSLDDVTLYSKRLIQFFQDFPNWRLEFKTKSAKVDQFLDVPHAGNVIVSWSVNPQPVIDHEEHGTASLLERLTAAEKCRERGFQISFHLDPMIHHPEWRENYSQLVDEITRRFTPQDIPYMSLGALRFQPEQRHIMRERFGMQSWVTQGEIFPGKDGKLRYDQNLRQEMFDHVIRAFKKKNAEWNVFLCMETPETWLGTFSAMPKSVPGLSPLFKNTSLQRPQAPSDSNHERRHPSTSTALQRP